MTGNTLFYWSSIILTGIGQVIELVFIVFLTLQFSWRKSNLRHAYYYILYITYIVDTFANVFWYYLEYMEYDINAPGVWVTLVYKWYFYFCPGIWCFMLGLNRCTAVAYPTIHQKMWTGRPLLGLLGITVLFPFIVNGYSFSNLYCRMYLVDPKCTAYADEFIITGIIVNTILAIASIVLIVIGIWNTTRINTNSFIAKVERRMVLYTMVSSIMVIMWFVSIFLSYQIPSMFEFFDSLSVFLFLLQHYPPMVALVMVNAIYRRAFFKFLNLDKWARKNTVVIAAIPVSRSDIRTSEM